MAHLTLIIFMMLYIFNIIEAEKFIINQPKGCGLEMVQGGYLKPTKLMYKVNETVHLECSTGAFVYIGNQLLSDTSSLNRSCLPNGTWSGPKWACGHPTKSSQGGRSPRFLKELNFSPSFKQDDTEICTQMNECMNQSTIASFQRPYVISDVSLSVNVSNITALSRADLIVRIFTLDDAHIDIPICEFNVRIIPNTIPKISDTFTLSRQSCPKRITSLNRTSTISISISIQNPVQLDCSMEICNQFYALDSFDLECPSPPVVLGAEVEILPDDDKVIYTCLEGYDLIHPDVSNKDIVGQLRCIQGLWTPFTPPLCIKSGTRYSGVFPQWANYVLVGVGCFLIGFPLGVFSLGFYIRKGNQRKKAMSMKQRSLVIGDVTSDFELRDEMNTNQEMFFNLPPQSGETLNSTAQIHEQQRTALLPEYSFRDISYFREQEKNVKEQPIYSNFSTQHNPSDAHTITNADDVQENIYANV